MKDIAYYSFPTNIYIGAGSRQLLRSKLQELGIHKPLLVTDENLVQMKWFVGLTKELAGHEPCFIFSAISGNPTENQVLEGVDQYVATGADGIVAVGGGAPLDVAKAIALLVHHPAPLRQYADGDPDALPISEPVPPIIALPTTAGTGSEVGRSAVISDDKSKVKGIYFSPKLLPSIVLADPELLLSLPPHLTAATGIDALTHLIEAFLAPGDHPLCDGIALEGIRLVARSLLPSIQYASDREGPTPKHLQARRDMLNASMMGAIAFQKGLGVCHSCAHSLSTVADLHHGLANALMLLPCMEWNHQRLPNAFDRMAQAAGVIDFLHWIHSLLDQCGLPRSLAEVGISEGQVPTLSQVAFEDPCHATNPCPVTLSDIELLFTTALKEPLRHV